MEKNMKILQTMYQEKVMELNDYKTMCNELQGQLKDLKDRVRWSEEKHNRKEEFDTRTIFFPGRDRPESIFFPYFFFSLSTSSAF